MRINLEELDRALFEFGRIDKNRFTSDFIQIPIKEPLPSYKNGSSVCERAVLRVAKFERNERGEWFLVGFDE